MITPKDTFGQEMKIGDIATYGDASRYSGVNFGVVTKMTATSFALNGGTANKPLKSGLVVTDHFLKNHPEWVEEQRKRFAEEIEKNSAKGVQAKAVPNRYTISIELVDNVLNLVIGHKAGTSNHGGYAREVPPVDTPYTNRLSLKKYGSGAVVGYYGKTYLFTTKTLTKCAIPLPEEGKVIRLKPSDQELKALFEGIGGISAYRHTTEGEKVIAVLKDKKLL